MKTSSAAQYCRASQKRILRAKNGVTVAKVCRQIVAGAVTPVHPAWHGRSAAVSEPERAGSMQGKVRNTRDLQQCCGVW